MWGQHLKRRGRWWHYHRYVPIDFQDLEAKKIISFSLRTDDFTSAKLIGQIDQANFVSDDFVCRHKHDAFPSFVVMGCTTTNAETSALGN